MKNKILTLLIIVFACTIFTACNEVDDPGDGPQFDVVSNGEYILFRSNGRVWVMNKCTDDTTVEVTGHWRCDLDDMHFMKVYVDGREAYNGMDGSLSLCIDKLNVAESMTPEEAMDELEMKPESFNNNPGNNPVFYKNNDGQLYVVVRRDGYRIGTEEGLLGEYATWNEAVKIMEGE